VRQYRSPPLPHTHSSSLSSAPSPLSSLSSSVSSSLPLPSPPSSSLSVRSNYFSASADPSSSLCVILDMDECLIHSQFPGGSEYRQLEERPQAAEGGVDNFSLELPDGDLVHVNKRPGLDEFLRAVSSQWETHVFTAAMEVYARPVLDVLDPDDEIFSNRYYRDSCTLDAELGVYVKDLTNVVCGRDLTKVVLVDNNPMSFLAQPQNGILVSNFYDDPADETLPAVLKLLEQISDLDDVRPKLSGMFGLKEALRDVRKGGTRP